MLSDFLSGAIVMGTTGLGAVGATALGTKVEVKNLNSFRSVRNAIAYEIARQEKVLNEGGIIEQVTMGWDENRNVTVLQRTKEGDTGYRYFPEPDLPPVEISIVEGLVQAHD